MRPRKTVVARLKKILGAAVLALSAACATTPSQDIAAARQDLDAYRAQCTARYGYDPDASSSLGPHVLGAGEREWRECVYQGMEKYLIPNSQTPEAYRKAIAEDREMTASIAAGKITRAQRRTRVQELLEELDRIEAANMAKTVLEKKAVDRVMREEMQRQLDSTRRSMIQPLAR
jgi:antitoxin component of MazEF toxin-antitoxin module